jgi:hypothetical protein
VKPGIHCVRTHWIRGFMAFHRVRGFIAFHRVRATHVRYLMPAPPSEWTTVPVMPRARSEARKT